MAQHVADTPGRDRWRLLAAVLVLAVIGTFVIVDRLGGTSASEETAAVAGDTPVPLMPAQAVVPGGRLKPKPEPVTPSPEPVVVPELPVLLPAAQGSAGSGLSLGALAPFDLPSGAATPVGTVSTAVANIPNRSSNAGFSSSMRTLAGAGPDFIMLNEVSRHSTDSIAAATPGYSAYRDPQVDRSAGGTQSMNNVVLWRSETWTMVAGGRVKLVDNDNGYRQGKRYTWDRYATWTVLQRADGAIVSAISTHMMTNPAKYPRQHGSNRYSRAQQYGVGMDILIETVRSLERHGPVIIGGDMNTHGREGSWNAASKLGAAGYSHAKDRAVMYVFFPSSARLTANREVRVASDHPAIVSSIDLGGA